jgi:hypothetical protein
MSTTITLMLYGHLRYHSPKVFGYLLWIQTNRTWQNGHSLLPLPVALKPAEVSFIGLPVKFLAWHGWVGAAEAAWRGRSGGLARMRWGGSRGLGRAGRRRRRRPNADGQGGGAGGLAQTSRTAADRRPGADGRGSLLSVAPLLSGRWRRVRLVSLCLSGLLASP